MTQLLITLELWTEILDRGVSLDCIYLDFKKAFDSVPHERLLSKLDAYGIGGPLKWTKDFLLDRKQCVVVNGKLSSWSLVLSGIPQGSVLGPILFVIFIKRSTVKIFADDTKIFRTLHEPEDYSYLQDDLDRFVEWSQLWQLHFNKSLIYLDTKLALHIPDVVSPYFCTITTLFSYLCNARKTFLSFPTSG